MSKYNLLMTGSVKDIYGEKGVAPYIFEYSDRYSVFDWGAMPDTIDDKGNCLAFMAWVFFDYLGNRENWKTWKSELLKNDDDLLAIHKELKEKGVKHHCIGLVDKDYNSYNPREINELSSVLYNRLSVNPVAVVPPLFEDGKWDYEFYKSKPEETLVPLEVIFRFGVPAGSSLLKRTSDEEYCKALGVTTSVKAGDEFVTPVIEFSTKLESTDVYMSYEKAAEIACLNDKEFKRLLNLTKILAIRLKDIFGDCGVKLWDGKFEYAFAGKDSDGNREFQLVDSIGPDELRLTYDGVQLSKENLRKFYRGSDWEKAVSEAKEIAKDKNIEDWKSVCTNELGQSPTHLKKEQKESVERMYRTLANLLSKNLIAKDLYKSETDLNELITLFKN